MDKKIAALLNTNLRVIIPDFGAFIIRQQNPKIIVFNEMLKNNDGLLLEYIIKTEGIEADIANQLLADYTMHAVRTIESGGMLQIDEIGTLRKDRNGNLIFIQQGREGANSDGAILAERKQIFSDQMRPENMAEPVMNRSAESFFLRILPTGQFARWIILIVCANLIVMAFFAFRNDIRNLFNKPDETYRISESVMDQIADSVRQDISDSSLISLENQILSTDPSAEGVRYYIVAGCFRDEVNADELVKELKSKGFQAAKFGKIGDLFAVSFGSYDDKDMAVKELARIREESFPDAWMTHF